MLDLTVYVFGMIGGRGDFFTAMLLEDSDNSSASGGRGDFFTAMLLEDSDIILHQGGGVTFFMSLPQFSYPPNTPPALNSNSLLLRMRELTYIKNSFLTHFVTILKVGYTHCA